MMLFYDDEGKYLRREGEDPDSGGFWTEGCKPGYLGLAP
jgi:hypothetical protein